MHPRQPTESLPLQVRPLTTEDSEWVEQVLMKHWGDTIIVAHGTVYHPQTLPGFVAIHRNAVDAARTLSPHIPLIGNDKISIHDEDRTGDDGIATSPLCSSLSTSLSICIDKKGTGDLCWLRKTSVLKIGI